jgi:hypothetical protein
MDKNISIIEQTCIEILTDIGGIWDPTCITDQNVQSFLHGKATP